MSTIVAIETSTERACVALLRNGLVTTRESTGVETHSMTVLPMLQQLLHEAGISLAQCDALAFGVGPGSFTGVRTACGLAQGLAFGASLPVVPVVSLLAMAQAARVAGAGNDIVAVLDARMGEVYWAQYRFSTEWQVVIAPALAKPSAVIAEGEVQVCGNGLLAYPADFTQLGNAQRHLAANLCTPHAADLLPLALLAVSRGEVLHARDAQPLYLRNKIALTTKERLAGVRS